MENLSPSQIEHWEHHLEVSKTALLRAMGGLGINELVIRREEDD